MAGHVLDAARDPGGAEPFEDRAAQRRHPQRLGAERAVADDVVRAGVADVERRVAVDRDPRLGELDARARAR